MRIIFLTTVFFLVCLFIAPATYLDLDCFANEEKCVSTITPIYNPNTGEQTGYSQKDNYTTRYYDQDGKQTGWQSNDQETLVDRN